jgi:5-methylcytosine-specific restriction endonuclease McrA
LGQNHPDKADKMRNIPRGQTEERRAYMKQYTSTHPPRDRKAYKKAYDQAHRAENAAYRISKGEELKAKKRAYYAANRERILANVKKRSDANPDKILDYQAAYYEKNSEKVKRTVKAYRKANPLKKMHLENKRRARKFNNGGSHTLDELIEKFNQLGNVCFYCGNPGKMTIDHDIPLSRGGTDGIDNILPACSRCNSKKKDKTADEYIQKLSRTNHAAIGGVGWKPQQKYEGR